MPKEESRWSSSSIALMPHLVRAYRSQTGPARRVTLAANFSLEKTSSKRRSQVIASRNTLFSRVSGYGRNEHFLIRIKSNEKYHGDGTQGDTCLLTVRHLGRGRHHGPARACPTIRAGSIPVRVLYNLPFNRARTLPHPVPKLS